MLHVRRRVGEGRHFVDIRADAYRGDDVPKEMDVHSGGVEPNFGGGGGLRLRAGGERRCAVDVGGFGSGSTKQIVVEISSLVFDVFSVSDWSP